MKHTLFISFLALAIMAGAGYVIISSDETRAAGNTYYVATNGSDSNPGTQAAPFRTINGGVSVLQPDDTLYVRAGTYTEALLANIPSGTSWTSPVTIAGYPGERATITVDSSLIRPLEFWDHQSYIIIKDLVLDANKRYEAIKIYDAHHIRFQNNEIKNGYGNCVQGRGMYIEFLANDFHGCGTRDSYGPGYAAVYLGGSYNLFDGNTSHDNIGGNLEGWESGNFYNCCNTFRNNLFYRNSYYRPDNANSGGAIFCAGMIQPMDNCLIYNNVIYDNDDGISVGNIRSKGHKIYNNTVYRNGIAHGGLNMVNVSDSEVRNNIVYENESQGFPQYSGNLRIRDSTNVIVTHNLVSTPIETPGSSGITLSNNIVGQDPGFVDTQTRDLHLTANSPAINRGTDLSEVPCDFDGNGRPAGSGYDIGAYEYGGTPSSNCPKGGTTVTQPSPSPTPPPKPIISLTLLPSAIAPGQTSLLQWSVQHATSCTAKDGWSGSKPLSGSQSLSPAATTLYTLSCTGEGGDASESVTLQVGSTGPCHTITSQLPLSSIPSGFGVPWDVLASSRALLISADCSAGIATLTVNTPSNPQYPYRYAYKTAYYVKQGQTAWTALPLAGPGLLSNAWFPQKATALIPLTNEEMANTTSVVAYMCTWTSTQWKCGCRDAACVQNYWQLQQVRR